MVRTKRVDRNWAGGRQPGVEYLLWLTLRIPYECRKVSHRGDRESYVNGKSKNATQIRLSRTQTTAASGHAHENGHFLQEWGKVYWSILSLEGQGSWRPGSLSEYLVGGAAVNELGEQSIRQVTRTNNSWSQLVRRLGPMKISRLDRTLTTVRTKPTIVIQIMTRNQGTCSPHED